MGEIRIVSPDKTSGYAYPVFKNILIYHFMAPKYSVKKKLFIIWKKGNMNLCFLSVVS